MDYEIVWTERASRDLQSIIINLAGGSPTATARVANAIVEGVELLRTAPHMGSFYPRGLKKARHRVIVSGKYRIFYRVIEKKKQVQIVTLWHGARQEPDLSES